MTARVPAPVNRADLGEACGNDARVQVARVDKEGT